MIFPPRATRRPRFYWFSFDGFPVTMPGLTTQRHFRWTGLYGVQIGTWFFGCIRGGPGKPFDPSELSGRPQRGRAGA